MTFHLITIFPEIFDSYLNESILKRAQKGGKIEIKIYNLRDFTDDKHKTTDDTPYGGGPGMVVKIEPIWRCVQFLKSKIKSKKSKSSHHPLTPSSGRRGKTIVILTSAKGEEYTQGKAESLKKYEHIIIICGRYEGVDERVAKYIADEEISIGKYILTGGELPAMVIVDSITRLIPKVLGNKESLSSESFSSSEITNSNSQAPNKLQIKNYKLKIKHDYPVYTKPAKFNSWKVPEVLQNGNHAEIDRWRKDKMKS